MQERQRALAPLPSSILAKGNYENHFYEKLNTHWPMRGLFVRKFAIDLRRLPLI